MKFTIIFGLCFAVTASHGQLLNPYLQGNNVQAVAYEKATGNLWFATANGLWQYDQKSFSEVAILPASVTSTQPDLTALIFAELNGIPLLWAASNDQGLFFREQENWKQISSDSGLPSNRVNAVAIDALGHLLWVGTNGGVGIFDGKTWRRITKSTYDVFEAGRWRNLKILSDVGLPDDVVRAVHPMAGGFIWIGTESGAARFSGNFDKIIDYREWFYCLPSKKVLAFESDLNGGIWAGTQNDGAFKLEQSLCPNSCLTSELGFNNCAYEVRGITRDYDNNLWFATNAGVIAYHPQTRVRRNLDSNVVKFVQTIFVDPDNNLWLGQSLRQGVLRLNNNWQAVDYKILPSSFISSFYLSHDTLWAGTSLGLQRIKEDEKIGEIILPLKNVSALAPEARGNVWAGVSQKDDNGEGIYLFDSKGKLLRHIRVGLDTCRNLNNDLINAILQRGDTLWVATDRGLNRGIFTATDTCWRHYDVKNHPLGLRNDVINALAFDQTYRLWCGTATGISVFDPRAERWIPPAELAEELPQIGGVATISIHPQNGEVWIGTGDEGLYIYSVSGVAHLDRGNVLPDNFVTSIAFTANNEAWVATRNGVARRDANNIWCTFTQSSGLTSNFVQILALQGDSLVWFGTAGSGITRYYPPASLPDTHLETKLDITDKSEVIYYFSATDLNTAADEFRYRYWLDNNPPSAPTFDRFAVVQVPEPGPHTFHVQALDRDGHLDRTEATDFFTRIAPELGGFSYNKAYFSGFDTVIAKIYWPPNLLAEDTEITITPITLAQQDAALFTFDFNSNFPFEKLKPLTLSFSFKRNEHAGESCAIWQESPPAECRGGTVEMHGDSLIIMTTITELGRYSLRRENCAATPSSTIAKADAQPRIFSPAGGGHGPETTLSFQLQNPEVVRVKVYNLAGRLVKTVCDQRMNAGVNAIAWNGRDDDNRICPSGLYIVVLESAGFYEPQTPIKVIVLNE